MAMFKTEKKSENFYLIVALDILQIQIVGKLVVSHSRKKNQAKKTQENLTKLKTKLSKVRIVKKPSFFRNILGTRVL